MLLRLFLALICLALPLQAEDLPDRTGPVILTVTGLDPAQFPDGRLDLDLPMLQAMGAAEFTTSTIWTEGVHVFAGVPVQTLAEQVKAGGHGLMLHALNDYSVEIPAADMSATAPLIAYAMDGTAMAVRDKGPLWVVYPFDDGAEYRTDTTFSRSIWQLDRIDVVP